MRIRKATDGRSNAPQRNGIAWQSAATEKLCKAEISNGKDKRRWAAQRNATEKQREAMTGSATEKLCKAKTSSGLEKQGEEKQG